MYIGQLAKLSGVSRKSIQHYEELGLIPIPKRKGIYRLYQEQDVELVKLIKCAQTLGFQLKELVGIAAWQSKRDGSGVGDLLELVAKKRAALQEQIAAAQRQDSLLAAMQEDLRSKLQLTCEEHGADSKNS